MADLDEISRAIGKLEAYNHDKQHAINNISAKIDAMALDMNKQLSDLKQLVDADAGEMRALKAKGAGVLIGLGLLAGAIGAKFSAILNAFLTALGKM